MGIFKKVFNETILFSKKGERGYRLILNLESNNNNIIIHYIEGKIKKKINISENNISNYKFLQKTNNLFYKKYKEITPNDLISEMDTGDAGIGGTSESPGSYSIDYADGDNRNVVGNQFPMTRRSKITDTFTKSKKKKKKKRSNGKKQKK
jgi:hypothetical protein